MQSEIYSTKTWTDKFIHAEPVTSIDKERVDKILDMIPVRVKTVLDVGVGGGYIYRKLEERDNLECFGIDISPEIVKKLGKKNVCVSDVRNIPYKGNRFDIVLATDLLEHIQEDSFDKSISEIKRVSKEYILINSPYKEAINWPVSRCSKCKKEFNIYGHVRKIDMKLIKRLFVAKEFDVLESGALGQRRELRPWFLVYMARKWGKVYSRDGVTCPHCFNSSIGVPERSFFSRLVGRIIYAIFVVLDKIIPPVFKSKNEMYILLRKKHAI